VDEREMKMTQDYVKWRSIAIVSDSFDLII
jgi:hypothetical protein